MKTQLFDDRGYLTSKTCKSLASYIQKEIGIDVEIHKTSTYLVFNYVIDGQMRTQKLLLPAGVLYCIKREDLQPILDIIKDEKTFLMIRVNQKAKEKVQLIMRSVKIIKGQQSWEAEDRQLILNCGKTTRLKKEPFRREKNKRKWLDEADSPRDKD